MVIEINLGEKHSKSSITEKSDGNGNLKDHFWLMCYSKVMVRVFQIIYPHHHHFYPRLM